MMLSHEFYYMQMLCNWTYGTGQTSQIRAKERILHTEYGVARTGWSRNHQTESTAGSSQELQAAKQIAAVSAASGRENQQSVPSCCMHSAGLLDSVPGGDIKETYHLVSEHHPVRPLNCYVLVLVLQH